MRIYEGVVACFLSREAIQRETGDVDISAQCYMETKRYLEDHQSATNMHVPIEWGIIDILKSIGPRRILNPSYFLKER